jgi:hypothetical protein
MTIVFYPHFCQCNFIMVGKNIKIGAEKFYMGGSKNSVLGTAGNPAGLIKGLPPLRPCKD